MKRGQEMNIKKAYGGIYETKEYSMFKYLNGNREIKKSNVDKIIDSIKENGYIENPILVNNHLEIIDGQHRLQALKELNLPVHYMVVDGAGLKECSVMNAKATAWNTSDYLNANIANDSLNAKYIKELANKYNLTDANAMMCIYNSNECNMKRHAIKDNEITDEMKETSEVIAKFVSSGVYDKNKGTLRALIIWFKFLLKNTNCDLDVLQNKLIKYNQIFKPYNNVENCIKSLEDVYNYRTREGKYLYASIEYEKQKKKDKRERNKKYQRKVNK